MHYLERRKFNQLKIYLFSATLAMVVLSAAFIAVISMDPIILGSELNGDGSIEYLCLGKDCEDLNQFKWVD